ncbi:hypothetical protein KCP69_17135 [Salmonella enterica subsp. enterica]|nr:hypothetical protein KCP69_17135 [Salmonella enterica subsp. enterica]
MVVGGEVYLFWNRSFGQFFLRFETLTVVGKAGCSANLMGGLIMCENGCLMLGARFWSRFASLSDSIKIKSAMDFAQGLHTPAVMIQRNLMRQQTGRR